MRDWNLTFSNWKKALSTALHNWAQAFRTALALLVLFALFWVYTKNTLEAGFDACVDVYESVAERIDTEWLENRL